MLGCWRLQLALGFSAHVCNVNVAWCLCWATVPTGPSLPHPSLRGLRWCVCVSAGDMCSYWSATMWTEQQEMSPKKCKSTGSSFGGLEGNKCRTDLPSEVLLTLLKLCFYKAQICINVTDEYFPRHPFYCAQGQQPLMGYFFLVCKVILDLVLRLWQNPHLLGLLRPFLPWPYTLGQHPILLKNCLVDRFFCHILHFYLIAFEIIAKLPAQCTNHFHFLSRFVVLRDVV